MKESIQNKINMDLFRNKFLSFREFITPSFIEVIFLIAIIVSAVVSLRIFFSWAATGFLGFVVGFFYSIIVFLISILAIRIACELIIILFQIYQRLTEIKQFLASEQPAAASNTFTDPFNHQPEKNHLNTEADSSESQAHQAPNHESEVPANEHSDVTEDKPTHQNKSNLS